MEPTILQGVPDLVKSGRSFEQEVNGLSGETLGLCLHCRTCAGGCPFVTAMDLHPHHVLRLIQLGFRQEALECSTIWICVACHTCSIQCPMAIDIAAIMDTLRHLALQTGVKIPEPGILGFHREVLNSLEHYGRTHKLEIMLRFKVRLRRWFEDMDVGLKMLAKRKLDLLPSRIKNLRELSPFFKAKERGPRDG